MLIFLVARTNPQSDGEAFYDACHAYVCIAKDEQAARELGGHSHNDEREEVHQYRLGTGWPAAVLAAVPADGVLVPSS